MRLTELDLPVSPEMALAEKLKQRETITKDDISALELFGDKYIDLLLKASQSTVRAKLADVLVHLWRDRNGEYQMD
ncbi:hypothetical protein LNK15_03100 [Jeotgalicoccus huakuii]|nr:hypothetical protein [Jeotgalicoccus huakuii]